MQKNWYILYTKAKAEFKVAGLLKKNKIETFVPVHYQEMQSFRRVINRSETPVFPSYVFVRTDAQIIHSLLKFPNVISLVYQLTSPAIISSQEIECMKDFMQAHRHFTLEKFGAHHNESVVKMDEMVYLSGHTAVAVERKVVKMPIPSLRVRFVAEIKQDNVFRTGVTFINNGERLSMQ